MSEIKFIHAADLHLDSPMIGLSNLPKRIFTRLQESTFIALKKVVDTAILQQVDFVILAGDLFDADDRSIRAQIRLRNEMERLQRKGISVFVIHGNHDFLNESNSYIQMPDNVHIFLDKVECKGFTTSENANVHLYGFSYPTRHVIERKIDEYEKKEGADFHIGILHGNLEGSQDHGNYAPFQIKDLLNKQFDYWALGHIHKRQILWDEPPIIYPGNVQGRNKKETGERGCYLVTLNALGHELDFIETADVLWIDLMIDASGSQDFHEVLQLSQKALDDARVDGKGVLTRLFIKNVSLDQQYSSLSLKSDLIEALIEMEHDEDSFVWTYEVQIEEAVEWNREHLASESDFYGELFHIINGYQDFDQTLSLLHTHPIARKYVNSLSIEDRELLMKEAEELLIRQLLLEK